MMKGKKLSELLSEIESFKPISSYFDDINDNYQDQYSYDTYNDIYSHSKSSITPGEFLDDLFSIMQIFLDTSISSGKYRERADTLWNQLSNISYRAVQTFYFKGSSEDLYDLKDEIQSIDNELISLIKEDKYSKDRSLYSSDFETVDFVRKIKKMKPLDADAIIPIANGGNEFGYIVANAFNISYNKIIPIRYSRLKSNDKKVRFPDIFQGRIEELEGGSVLVVDDVVYTGRSLNKVNKFLESKKIDVKDNLFVFSINQLDPMPDANLVNIYK